MKEMLLQKRNQKGFTLMEMLIVVAIIAILVAIAIPVFNAQLEKSREATDEANVRAAKAIAIATYLTDGTSGTQQFDAVNGKLVAVDAAVAAYGKGTDAGTDPEAHTTQVIEVTVGTDGTFSYDWVTA